MSVWCICSKVIARFYIYCSIVAIKKWTVVDGYRVKEDSSPVFVIQRV